MSIEMIRQIDRLEERLGGRFVLTALIQRRIKEVILGSPKLIQGKTPLRSALAEIEAGMIAFTGPPEPAAE